MELWQLKAFSESFHQIIIRSLQGENTSLKMLPSYLSVPDGREQGIYLAVDFGGTNIRIIKAELLGQGNFRILQKNSFPLRDKIKTYDFTKFDVSGAELFGFIAEQIEKMITPHDCYPSLGFTFSFPSRQTGINQAVLLKWTKEIETSGVVGQDVGELLARALEKTKLFPIKTAVIINDTVGTLLAGAYQDKNSDIASICGTGHNTCYLEPCAPLTGKPMIINLESGNFDLLPLNKYDRQLDLASHNPGEQLLEKITGGYYLGEHFRLITLDYIKDFKTLSPYSVKTEDLVLLLADISPDLNDIKKWLSTKPGLNGISLKERKTLQNIAASVISRSAQLIAATFAGILKHIDPCLNKEHTIAIDGSLYEHLPGYAEQLKETLALLLGERNNLVTIKLFKDGSGVGAAIAASIVTQDLGCKSIIRTQDCHSYLDNK